MENTIVPIHVPDAAEENLPVPDPIPEAAERPTRKTQRASVKSKEPCRTLEELVEAGPKSMNTAETTKLINHLRDENMLLRNKVQEMEVTAQKAFAQFRTADENYQRLTQQFNYKLGQIRDLSRVYQMSLNMTLNNGGN